MDDRPSPLLLGKETFKTRVLAGTRHPEWSEAYMFSGDEVAASHSMVSFEVWSHDDYHPHPFLGQVREWGFEEVEGLLH